MPGLLSLQIVSALESLSHPENDEISDFYSKDLFSRTTFHTKCLQLSFLEQALYSQQKQAQKLTVAQIMNSLLRNSDLN